MPQFSIAESEKKTVATVTFNKSTDYKAVTLKSGKTALLHHIQADRLIANKKATLAKDVKVKEGTNERTKVKVSED